MKITKRSKVQAASRAIKASKSTADMLEAFEDKLAEFGIESKTCVEGASDIDWDDRSRQDREVEVYGEDYNERYEDVGGGFDTDGIITLAEIKDYWNKNNISDPVLRNYSRYEDWWRDTRDNFLIEASTDVFDEVTEGELDAEEIENIDGGCSIKGSIVLDENEKEQLLDAIDKYNTSNPVSGKWSLETMDEKQTIADLFNITLDEATDVMIDYLGFSKEDLLTDTEGGSWFLLKDLSGNVFTEHFKNAGDAAEFADKYGYVLEGPADGEIF